MKSIWRLFKNRGFLIGLCLSVFLFGGGIALGLVAPSGVSGSVSDELASTFGGFAKYIAPFSFATMLFIFVKNTIAVLFCFFLAPFFCIVPFIVMSFNGLVIGLVSGMVAGEQSVGYLMAGLLPHGVIEIPALLIGGAVAFSFGAMAMGAVFSEKRRSSLSDNFKRNIKCLAVAVALLFVAAGIETFITPLVMGVK